jgi:D-mannonate dehydratase
MTEGSIYEVVETYTRQGKVAHVHLRNVRGKAPFYKETFIDEGDVDVLRVLRILNRNSDSSVRRLSDWQMRKAKFAGGQARLGHIAPLLYGLETSSSW